MPNVSLPVSVASLAAIALCAVSLGACGGSTGLLSSSEATSLNDQLDSVDAAVAAGDCPAAALASARLKAAAISLSPTVDSALRSNLSEGASTVAKLALTDCSASSTTTTTTPSTTSSTTTPTTSSSTSSSTSTSTSTSSSTTTTTPTTTTTTTTPTTTTDSGGAIPK